MTQPDTPLLRMLHVLDGETLRQLAALSDGLHRPHFIDSEAAANEMAELAESGLRPTIGWYRRRILRTPPPPAPAPSPETIAAAAADLARDVDAMSESDVEDVIAGAQIEAGP